MTAEGTESGGAPQAPAQAAQSAHGVHRHSRLPTAGVSPTRRLRKTLAFVRELTQATVVAPKDPYYVREMELDDLAQVYALGESLFTAERWPALYRTWDDYELAALYASDSDYCLVAAREKDERILGFVLGTMVTKRGAPWTYGWIIWLGVDATLGRQGVARRLVDRLTDVFIDDGASMLIVDTDAENRPALRFFEKQGFGQHREHVYLSRNLRTHPRYQKRNQKPDAKPDAKPDTRPDAKPDEG